MDYEEIKQLAKIERATGDRPDCAGSANHPFYSGTPNDWALAEWFASLWRAFGYTDRVHIRRVHYQIIAEIHLCVCRMARSTKIRKSLGAFTKEGD